MWSIILMFLAGICNACMDVVKVRWETSKFKHFTHRSWFDPSISWKNKWKDGDESKGEKFFGSSTFLVWITDFWHFSKTLMLTFITLSIVFYQPIFNWYCDAILLYVSFTVTFEIFFSKILKKS